MNKFNHVFRTIPKEEIMLDRSNAYKFIDFENNQLMKRIEDLKENECIEIRNKKEAKAIQKF